jgi:phage gpG-like protein
MNNIKKRWQMMMKKIAKDIGDEFDQNFERKAFFDKKWKDRKYKNKGSLMNISGNLRFSIEQNRKVYGNTIEWSSSLPYAKIHNEGGVIEQERKYRETKNPMYKASALAKKVRIPIPKRQYIGYHKYLDAIVEKRVEDFIDEVINEQLKQFKR